ncbi:MAG: AI-2E family transporter [Acidobacteriota bacterium]
MEPAAPPSSPTRTALQVLLVVILVTAGLWALHRVEQVVLVLILAVFFAYLIVPLVDVFQRPLRAAGIERRLARGFAIGLVYLLILGIAIGGAAILLPRVTRQIGQAAAQAPVYGASLRAWEQGWVRYYERFDLPTEVRASLDRSVLGMGETTAGYARGLVVNLIGDLVYLPWLVLVPVLSFFLLRDAEALRRVALKALPHDAQLRAYRLVEDMSAAFAAYIRAQFLACALVGITCGVVFEVLGMPYPVLLGMAAGVMEFVPLVGPLLIAVVTAIIAVLQTPVLAIWVLGCLLLIRVVEDYVVYPKLIGRGLHLHPLTVILAVLVGVELDGLAGLFVAIPAVALVSVAFRHWLKWRKIDAWAADEPPTPAVSGEEPVH